MAALVLLNISAGRATKQAKQTKRDRMMATLGGNMLALLAFTLCPDDETRKAREAAETTAKKYKHSLPASHVTLSALWTTDKMSVQFAGDYADHKLSARGQTMGLLADSSHGLRCAGVPGTRKRLRVPAGGVHVAGDA